ncbi:MAG: OmpH family outer membrane protein [Desulfovibrio sp.]|nr:OmpH family outer membrane protein [Desulfovibrio sp.]
MRTSRIIAPLLMGLFVLTGCQQQESQVAQPKIAIVDMGRVMRDSEPGKEGVKFLEAQQAGMQEQLDAIQDRLEKNPKDEAAMQELQRVYAASQQRMQAEQQNVVNLLFDSVQRVVNSYREAQGFDIILAAEAVASAKPGADVTAAVIAEVNKQKVEFKPVPESALSGMAPEGVTEAAPAPVVVPPAAAEKPAEAAPAN